jgi:hypothetical protein
VLREPIPFECSHMHILTAIAKPLHAAYAYHEMKVSCCRHLSRVTRLSSLPEEHLGIEAIH